MGLLERVLWAGTSLPAVIVLVLAVACSSGCAAAGNWDTVDVPERGNDPQCGELGECAGEGQ